MSEYQHYEFQTIDTPLTEEEMQELRQISSRADISPSSFTVEYNYSDLRADPKILIEQYFDAFCYVANWGTHWLMFKVPAQLIDAKTVEQYSAGEVFSIDRKGDDQIFEFKSEDEYPEWEDGEGRLSSMISLRTELLYGDYRCLYLAWLYGVQMGGVREDEKEPPVPPGLNKLNTALSKFIDFLSIDPDLVAVAARASKVKTGSKREKAMRSWLKSMNETEKDNLLSRFIEGEEPLLGLELRQHFLKILAPDSKVNEESSRRTAMELLAEAETHCVERKRMIAEKEAREHALREKERILARNRYLNNLVGQEKELWYQVNSLVQNTKPKDYDQAVQHLLDLRDLAIKANQTDMFARKFEGIVNEHRRKPSFIKRLVKTDLMTP